MNLIQFIVAVIATMCFSILFQAPPRHYVFCGLVGGVGWTVYLIASQLGGSQALACFLSALVITTLARLSSVWRKTPSTVFLIAGIFPLVPGAGIYFTAYSLFAGDYSQAAAKGMETLIIAGTLSLGILFGSAVPQAVFQWICRLRPPK
ncbi:threonine/serine exporter family protein [Ruminococcaceae bacterium OttesenSCG-928-L11]|nr:threonine/serine exporter family protein [Ruminococcaceae bacterium OttesenSCG-928-L11]